MRPFISVLLGLTVNFGQISSFYAFDMFLQDLLIFSCSYDQPPSLYDPLAGIQAF